jgi:hypothetical protein
VPDGIRGSESASPHHARKSHRRWRQLHMDSRRPGSTITERRPACAGNDRGDEHLDGAKPSPISHARWQAKAPSWAVPRGTERVVLFRVRDTIVFARHPPG